MAPDNTARYTGEFLDSDSGLYDLRARQYDAATARFLSLDPRASSVSDAAESSYVYARNSPAAYVDPSGLGAIWILDRLRGLVDKACSSSPVIPLTFAIASAVLSPVILGYWLLGFMLACTSSRSFKHAYSEIGDLFGSFGAPIDYLQEHRWARCALMGAGAVTGIGGYGLAAREAISAVRAGKEWGAIIRHVAFGTSTKVGSAGAYAVTASALTGGCIG